MNRLLAIFMTLCMVLGLSGINVWAADGATWQEEPPMSTAKYGATSCALDDKIYVFGGTKTSNAADILDMVEIYDTKTETWSKGKPMLEVKLYPTASVVGHKIYVMGGQSTSATLSTSVLIYDTKTDTWTRGKSMPTASHYRAPAVVGNKIYVIGGFASNKATVTMDVYDTETDSWFKGTPLTTGRYGVASAVFGNKIYVMGGKGESGITDIMEVYDTETATWSAEKPMPKAINMAAFQTVGDKVYVMGGQTISTGPTNTVLIYSITKRTWETGPSMNTPGLNQCSAAVNGKIYVTGGTGYEGSALNTMESINVFKPQLSVLLNTDETVQLSISYNLADNTVLTWSSTNEAVATVDKNGKVTAIGEGQADIYAQNADGTFKEFISVKVVPGTANGMRLAAHLKVGEKVKLHLFDDPSRVTWKSMDEGIATVSEAGQVTATKKGLAIIQGELEGQTYQIYVRVNG